MPKLDKTGPEGKGPRSGRNLGKCNNREIDDEEKVSLNKGMGLKRKSGGGKGLGDRLRSIFRCT